MTTIITNENKVFDTTHYTLDVLANGQLVISFSDWYSGQYYVLPVNTIINLYNPDIE